MRILFLTKTDRAGPSSRLRFYNFIPALEARQHEVVARPLFDATWLTLREAHGLRALTDKARYAATRLATRALAERDATTFDLIVVEGQCFPYLPALLETWLFAARAATRAKLKIVVEFDDAIYLTPLHRKKLEFIARNADHVIVGNPTLATWARSAGAHVSIVPTVYPAPPPDATATIHTAPFTRARPLRVGWVGLPYNFDMLATAVEPLAALAPSIPLELVVVSSRPPRFAAIEPRFIAWSEHGEAAAVASFDIGIMPLPDNEWARGKCGAKLIQMMLAGVPTIASPVGINRDILAAHEALPRGLAASTPEEWRTAIARLARDPGLRTQLAARGREYALANYSLSAWSEKLPNLYEAIVRGEV